jgi:hypothetical protein
VTTRATDHLSPTATATVIAIAIATMVNRRMDSRIVIGLLRDILWTRSLDENKQDQQNKLYPVAYHTLSFPWGLVSSSLSRSLPRLS